MAWSILRIDLNERSRDFQTIAVQPGFPVLDRFSANAGSIRHWLGRFAADAQWDGQTVRFFWRDDDIAAQPTNIVPATKSDMQNLLRTEVDALRAKLKQAVVKTATDRALLAVMQQRLDRVFTDETLVPGMFFKVRVQGHWRLLWCWGYDRRRSKSGKMAICPNESCQLAFFDDPNLRHRCPRCGTKAQSSRMSRVLAMIACLILVCAGGFVTWDRAGRPGFAASVKLKFEVVDAITEKPILGVKVKQSSDTETNGLFTKDPVIEWEFKYGRGERLQVSAPGYRPAQWEPPAGPLPADMQRVTLHGESELTGLIVEEGTDHPIPYASIRMPESGHAGTADDVGLFLLPGVPSGLSELEVSATGYQTQRVKNDLKPGHSPELLVSLTGSGAVDGTIADAFSKQPISNAIVKIVGRSAESKADENGIFHYEQLPGTTCQFEVAAPGYFTREFDRPLVPTGPTRLRFLLRPDLTTLDGQVVDSTGTPIDSAKVRLVGQDSTTTTSSEGRFHLTNVQRGSQQVEATAAGYATQIVTREAPTRDGQTRPIVLKGPARLNGVVLDAAKRTPVSDAEVRLSDGRWKTATDKQGRFALVDLPTGTASLQVIGRGYQTSQSEAELKPGDMAVQIELNGATVLSGKIVSAFDQQPIEGASVQLEGVALPATTNAEGRFRFEGVVPGSTLLQVTADGFQAESVTHEIRSDEETPVSIELRGTARLEGRVVSAATGQPIDQATLTIIGTNRTVVTNDRGEFAEDGWPGRPIRMAAAAKGYLTEDIEQDLSRSDAMPLLVRLKTAYSVKGQVIDAGSQHPVAGAKVTIDGRNDSIVSDADGKFELATLQSATHEFAVTAAGYPPQSFVERSEAKGVPTGGNTTDVASFKLRLQRDSEQMPAFPSPESSVGESSSRITGRDPLDVAFFGVRTKAANIGFVVDCSGSMSGLRLQRTKLELLNSVLNLHPKQMYYVSFFDDNPVLMFDGQKQPVIASPLNKVRTYKWMKHVNGGGATNPPPALKIVAEMNPQAIYLLSDGNFDPLEDDLFDLLSQRKIRVNTLAFEDESGKKELERIANRTGGTYRFIPKDEIPELYELTLVTRLYEELVDQWLDSKASSTDRQDAHEALVEFCDGRDFGPNSNANDLDRRHARSSWQRWWVEHKLVPEVLKQDESKLQRNLGNRDLWWRWASIEALSQKDAKDGNLFIPKVRDAESGIRQASRRALAKLAGDEDFGPAEDASPDAQREAFEKWTGWWHRQRYITGLKKKLDESLIQDFESSDLKTRRAAVQVAADRDRFHVPQRLIPMLTDADFSVRQSAHDALAKAAGKDLGPGDCSDVAVCAAAAKEWQKWYGGRLETEADKILRLAESFETLQRADAAREWFQKIVDKFPGTEAAKRAAAKLK